MIFCQNANNLVSTQIFLSSEKKYSTYFTLVLKLRLRTVKVLGEFVFTVCLGRSMRKLKIGLLIISMLMLLLMYLNFQDIVFKSFNVKKNAHAQKKLSLKNVSVNKTA